MSLTKQIVPMSFSQGMDTKTDPKQVPAGKLLLLKNARFKESKSLIKRYGYETYSVAIGAGGSIASGISCFGYKSEALLQTTDAIYAYSELNDWTKRSDFKNFDFSASEVKSDGISKSACAASYDPTTDIEIYVYANEGSNSGLYFTAVERSSGSIIYDNELLDSPSVTQVQIHLTNSKWTIIYSTSDDVLNYIIKDPASLSTAVVPVQINADLTFGQCFDSTVLSDEIFIAVHTDASEIKIYRMTSAFVFSLRRTLVGPVLANTVGIAAYSTTRILVMYSDQPNTYIKIFDDTNVGGPEPTQHALSTRTAWTISAVFDSGGNAQVFYFNYSDLGFPRTNSMFSISFSALNVSGVNNVISSGVLFASKAFLKNGYILFYATPMSSTRKNQNKNTLTTTDQQGLYLCGVEFGGTDFKVHQKSNAGTFGFTETAIRALTEVCFLTEDSIEKFIFGFLKKTRVIVTNAEIGYINSVARINSFESLKAAQRQYLGESLIISAGQTYGYDGANLVESGFNIYPSIDPAEYSRDERSGGLGTYGATTTSFVQFVATYEWTDQNGNLQRSAPSDPVPIQIADSSSPAGTRLIYNFNVFQFYNPGSGLPINGVLETDKSFADFSANVIIGDIVNSAIFTVGTTIAGIFDNGGTALITVSTSFVSPGPTLTAANRPASAAAGSYTAACIAGAYTFTTTAFAFKIGQRITTVTGSPAGFPNGAVIQSISEDGTIYTTNIVNGSTGNYIVYSPDSNSFTMSVRNTSVTDKENISIVLWRTKLNGSTYYRVSDISLPAYNSKILFEQSLTDRYSDAELDGNEQLYTTGGEVENIAPPAFSVLQSFKNRLIGVTKDNENQVSYSKQVIDGYGVEFNDSFLFNVSSTGGEVSGVGVIDEKLIFFKSNKIYYVLGDGPNPMGLQNDFTPCNPINADAGCVERNSIVNIPEGIIFKSEKGFYLLNRSIGLEYIGDAIEEYNQYTVVSSRLLESAQEVRIGLSNGVVLVYDYYHKQWSTDEGQGDSIEQNDADNINGIYHFLNSDGILKKENSSFADQRTVATVQTPTYIPIELDTGWLSFVGIEAFQRIYKAILLGEYKSNHLLTVQVYYDFNEDYFDTISINDVGAAINVFTYRLFMPRQKCTSIRYKIKESQYLTTIGEGLRLSSISFEVGVKKGLNKIKAANSFG